MHSLVFFLSLLPLTSRAGHWCYDSQDVHCGPSNWQTQFETCGKKKQSPINIVTGKAKLNSSLCPFNFEGYDDDMECTIRNNGHSVQVDLAGDISISGGGLPGTFKALQFHYHWGTTTLPGSEHTINRLQYPMELHIVHMNVKYLSPQEALKHSDGLAVLGFMIIESAEASDGSKDVIEALNNVQHNGTTFKLKRFSLKNMIPDQEKLKKYYRYQGSLTTPPCSEAVIWTMFAEPIQWSNDQINAFPEKIFFNGSEYMVKNFRTVQNPNGRMVYVSNSAVGSFHVALLWSVPVVWASVLLN
ncbi:carbonic anhydrase 4a isoform X1 [Hypanus sabinus]|uniref:carbonic anhydrase 4a isoform X1 n=1 Tax=Hypanus sabinus TaxID=79690 RepID=UPI0028C508E3|nr:carbonic anhydrase 4a isoform X1 [Hypanus sabinus]